AVPGIPRRPISLGSTVRSPVNTRTLARPRTSAVTPFTSRRVRGTTKAGRRDTAYARGANEHLGTEPDRLGLRAVARGAHRRARGTTTAGMGAEAYARGSNEHLGTEPDRRGLRAVATGAHRRARFRGQRRCGEPHHRAAVAALCGGPGIRHPLLHQLPGWFG